MKVSRCCFSSSSLTTLTALTTLLCLACTALVLVACSSNGKQWNPDDYTVKSGDTVYSIAWRYELDPETFADWNNLSVSKWIKPGQRLHTRKPQNFSSSRSGGTSGNTSGSKWTSSHDKGYSNKRYTNKKWITVKKGDSLSLISNKSGVSVNRLAELNQLKKPYVIQTGQTIFLKPLTTASRSSSTNKYKSSGSSSVKKQQQKPKSQSRAQSSSHLASGNWPKSVRWKRPANGKVVKKFNSKRNDAKGIDIKGKSGDPILASASGRVVYSGNGLISYGNLIIIKHNKIYLSAYAYNRKLLVKEGDTVKAGQKIAEMGHKNKQGARLHFEIRKNGKPVDPLKYLPWNKT